MDSFHLSRGRSYTDRDGQVKNFTIVDWSPKTTVAYNSTNMEEVKKSLDDYRKKVIEDILAINPVFTGMEFATFVKRDNGKLEWHEEMVRDEGLSIDDLRTMRNLLENRQEAYKINN